MGRVNNETPFSAVLEAEMSKVLSKTSWPVCRDLIFFGGKLPELKDNEYVVIRSYDGQYSANLCFCDGKHFFLPPNLYKVSLDLELDAYYKQIVSHYGIEAEIPAPLTFYNETEEDMKKDIDWLTSGWEVGTIVPRNVVLKMKEIRKKYNLE